ncbi:hypothetical protein BOX15_Mlig009999g1, partial [Macrostomum lignano]
STPTASLDGPETRADPMRINSLKPNAQHKLRLDSIYTQLEESKQRDSTQASMKWQLVLGLLVLAALVVVEPSEAKAESESKEDPSDSDDSKLSEEQFPKLRKKGFHVHFHG